MSQSQNKPNDEEQLTLSWRQHFTLKMSSVIIYDEHFFYLYDFLIFTLDARKFNKQLATPISQRHYEL